MVTRLRLPSSRRHLLALGLAAPLAAPALARAESAALPCFTPLVVRPGVTEAVPGNIPAIVVTPPSGVVFRPLEAYELELRDRGGQVIPLTTSIEGPHYLLRPSRTLSPGTHFVRYRDFCNVVGSSTVSNANLKVEGTVPLPASSGTFKRVDVSPAGFFGYGKDCRWSGDVGLRVRVESPTLITSYRSVTRWKVNYKTESQNLDYGAAETEAPGWYHFDLKDRCQPGQARITGQATIEAQIAGTARPLAPVSVAIDVACPVNEVTNLPPQCWIDGGPHGPPPKPAVDAGTPDVAVPPPATSPLPGPPKGTAPPAAPADAGAPQKDELASSSGCSTGGRAAPGAGIALVTLLSWLGLRRRRRA